MTNNNENKFNVPFEKSPFRTEGLEESIDQANKEQPMTIEEMRKMCNWE